jgi:REP element-mobilizing transposase RayT
MPNHVHLILAPTDIDRLRQALAAVHRRYAGNYGDRITVPVHLIYCCSRHGAQLFN